MFQWGKVHNKTRGGLLVEALISVFIFSIVSSSVLYMVLNSGTYVHRETNFTDATYLAKEGQEATLSIQQRDWTALPAGTYGLASSSGSWVLQGSSDTAGIFTRRIAVTTLSTTTKRVVTTVSWQDDNQPRTVNLEQTLTDWTRVVNSGIGSFDIGDNGNNIFKKGNYIYLALDNPAGSFVIVDASNPSGPTVLSTSDYGNSGLDVYVEGNYAYLALNSNKVIVIDVSDPVHPHQVATINTQAKPNAVYVNNGYLYIGLNRTSYSLYLYNVANPLIPRYFTRSNIGAVINDVQVYGGYIYYAINSGIGFDFSTNHNYIFVGVDFVSGGFEVYSMPIVRLLKTINIGGRGRRVATDGTSAYVSAINNTAGVVKINVSDPLHPAVLSTYNVGGEGNSVVIDATYLYVAVENRDGGLYIGTK